MKKENLPNAGKRKEKLLCGVASVLFPTSILCYFCAQNINEFTALWLIFFILGTMIVLAALAYCAALLILKRSFLALVFCAVCWIGCYLEPPLLKLGLYLKNNTGIAIKHIRPYIALLIFVAAVLAVYLLRRMKRDMRKPVAFFLAFSALILVFNLASIAKAGFSLLTDKQTEELPYQTDFFVDAAKTDTPNVYWIHSDGMLGVGAVEKYFHDEQSAFLSGLTVRGFSINPSAHFEAGARTAFSIPVLMCPYAYDTWLSDYTVTHEAALHALESFSFNVRLRDVRSHNEMVAAFDKKGYVLDVISSDFDVYYTPMPDRAFYNISNSRDEKIICGEEALKEWIRPSNMLGNVEQISGFLSQIFGKVYKMIFLTPLSQWFKELTMVGSSDRLADIADTGSQPFTAKMPEEQLRQIFPYLGSSDTESKSVRSLYDILYGKEQDLSQKLIIIHDDMPHYPFVIDENGKRTDHMDSMNPMNYYPQHIFSTKVLIDMIDMILEVDPDAVIVIQSDHGLHGNTEEDFKAAFGEDADALELWNGTMSAIRVPEKYQTGEEHYAVENPLNMSRYLVNSFVGENYEYLPPN